MVGSLGWLAVGRQRREEKELTCYCINSMSRMPSENEQELPVDEVCVCLMFFNHSEELRHARDTTNDPASDRFRTRRFTGTPQTASCGCMHRTQRAGAIIRDRDRARTNTADGAEGGRKERETVTGACVASEAEDPISARRRGSSKPRSPLLPPPSPPKGERGEGGLVRWSCGRGNELPKCSRVECLVTHSGLAGV